MSPEVFMFVNAMVVLLSSYCIYDSVQHVFRGQKNYIYVTLFSAINLGVTLGIISKFI